MVSLKTTTKTNRVLQIIFLFLLVILFRIWLLTIVHNKEGWKDAKKPQERTITLSAARGTIVDRDQMPLAVNRIRYDAAIYYSHIRQIPSVRWKKNEKGEKAPSFPRKEYIQSLSQLLAKELHLNAEAIEDQIHAKASILPHLPFIIKENISEEEFYRLRALETTWTGLHASTSSERYYPGQKFASDILGYLGSMSEEEYWTLASKIQMLQSFFDEEEAAENPPLPDGYRNREELFKDLASSKERMNCMNDLIGKAGLEKRFEEPLKGTHGKKNFEVDINGNFLRQLPQSEPPISGKPLICSISSPLQSLAEELLAEDEKYRDGKSLIFSPQEKKKVPQKQPLLKGGAIVALDPLSGEILALASYPRLDPNDFVPSSNPVLRKEKQKNVQRWLETPSYIANLWDGKEKLVSEYYCPKKKEFFSEKKELSFELFLETILPFHTPLWQAIEKIGNVQTAAALQEDVESLLYYSGQKNAGYLFDLLFPKEEEHLPTGQKIPEKIKEHILQNWNRNLPEVLALKKKLLVYFAHIPENQNKLLLTDLCRIFVHSPAISDELLQKIGTQTLSDYWKLSKAKCILEEAIYDPIFSLFHEISFKTWREKNQKEFLKQKRAEEKKEKRYARPYVDYLQEMEKKLFQEFWKKHSLSFLSFLLRNDKMESSELDPYFHCLSERKKELSLDSYSSLQKTLSSLSPSLAIEYLRSFRSFQELDRPLLYPYPSLKKNEREKDLAASFYYPHSYGTSFAYRHGAPPGSIFKLVTAYSALKERYLKLYPSSSSLNPFTMIEEFSYAPSSDKKHSPILGHDLHGKPFPQYYKGGRLPRSIHKNAGKLDLISALEQSSNCYFALLSSDILENADSLLRSARNFGLGEKTQVDLPGEASGFLPTDLRENPTGLYSFAIGQHTCLATPLQIAVMLSALTNGGKVLKPQILKNAPLEIQNEISLPLPIQKMIFEAMDKVISGEKGSARASIIKKLSENPSLLKDYKDLHHQFIGKTSTAEFTFKSDILPSSKAEKYNDTWFGAISFDPNFPQWEKPELVIVVYSRFGNAGKDAAPLAAQMVKKYRELKNR